ncbi:MAG: universal stress protein [Acidobacteriota bacterium]
MIKRILCPVDFSEATPYALKPAVSLATEFGAELLLLHVLDYPYPHVGPVVQGFDIEDYYGAMEEKAHEQLEGLIDDDVREYATVRVAVERGSAFREIVRLAEEEDPNLIVLPTHARTGLDHMLWGSVAEKVVRLAPCAVMTVSPRQGEPQSFGGKRVLLATDFSPGAEHALETAVSFARHYGAELLMVHVVTVWDYDPANPEWRFPPLPAEHVSEIESHGKERLEEASETVSGDGVQVRTLLVRGFDPGLEIARTAEDENADLLVMSTHGRTGVSHLVIGSTAERVVRYATCPVLTVKKDAPVASLDN